MDALLPTEVFTGFGSDELMPYERVGLELIQGESKEELRAEIRRMAPRQPGVYGMLNAIGQLVYVGKSKSLRNRLLSYFLPNNEDEKAGRIVQCATQIVWERQPSDFAALLREQYLIRTFQPRFNVQGMPNRQKAVFLCLGRSPVETFYLSSEPDPKAIAWDGPLFGAGRVRRAVEVLNRVFRLRDCSNKTRFSFRSQLPLFEIDQRAGCFRWEIQTCLGPCAEGCSRSEYWSNVERAREFLTGNSQTVCEQLERRMLKAAGRQHYEQAIKYREDWNILKWLSNRLTEHARAREELTCVYRVVGVDGREIWYLIRRGVVEHAVASPAKLAKRSREKLLREIEAWFAEEKPLGNRLARREESLALISAWFRKHPTETCQTIMAHELNALSSSSHSVPR